jgi:hypothetical protein
MASPSGQPKLSNSLGELSARFMHVFGIPCAAWRCHASAQSLDSLDLAKNPRF